MTPAGGYTRLPADERRAIAKALTHAARHDATLHAMLVTRLIEANTADLAALHKAIARRDWPGVHRSAHRLKGSAALARCATLVAAGKSLESAAGQGSTIVVNTLFPRYVAIVAEFNATLAALCPAEDDGNVADEAAAVAPDVPPARRLQPI